MEEQEELFLTPDEQLQHFSDRLIGSIIKTDSVAFLNRQYLFGQLEPSYFRDENHILYKVLYKLKEQGVVPDKEFLELHFLLSEKTITDSKELINMNAFAGIDENPVVSYASAVLKQHTRLLQEDQVDVETYKLIVEKYKLLYQAIKLDEVYSQSKLMLHETITIGRKSYQGYEDSSAYCKENIAKLDAVTDKNAGIGFINASEYGLEDKKENKPEKIGDFGEIDELNKHFGGIYTPNFYSVSAPTKGGKSKFCSKILHNCIMQGTNGLVWAHEGGHEAWLAQFRAIHFNWYYNRGKSIQERITGVDQDTILKDAFKDARTRELEQISKEDLFTNPNYGKVYLIDRPFVVETFIDEIETGVQLSGAKIILIDYLQLIGSSKGVSKNERIGEAYQKLLAYQKKRNIASINPAQFKQEFMDALGKTKDLGSVEARTGGGESSEIVRTPDINIALYASPEDLINQEITLLSIPSRMASPFIPFRIHADLGTCEFCSMKKEAS